MIYAYDKVYLRIAQRSLGEMLSYAVYDLGYELEDYYKRFLQSEYSVRFSKGDLFVITGMSGAELAIRVLNIPDDDIIMPSYNTAKSQEYWTGWILAYYQWENGKTFEMIDKEIPICKIRNMYNPYHEMDISSAILKLREMSQVSRAETYLKKLRKELKELPYGFGASVGYSMIFDNIKTIDDAINEATIDMRKIKEEANDRKDI